jgi:AcrR family transcriptional regulator
MSESPASKPVLDPRQRLLDAAEELFATRGFDGASVRDICEKAGMNVASVNYHFGDKQRLYVETLKQAHACADAGDEEGFPDWPPGTPPVDMLRGFIRIMAARMHVPARPTAMQLLMREFAHPSAAGQEIILRYIQPKAFRLRDVLSELLPGADSRRLLMIGFSVIGQILFYRQNRPVVELMFGKERVDALDLAAVTDHVTRFTLAALGRDEPYPYTAPPAEDLP